MTAGPDDMRCGKDLSYATPAELKAVDEALDAVDAEVEAVFAKYRRA